MNILTNLEGPDETTCGACQLLFDYRSRCRVFEPKTRLGCGGPVRHPACLAAERAARELRSQLEFYKAFHDGLTMKNNMFAEVKS